MRGPVAAGAAIMPALRAAHGRNSARGPKAQRRERPGPVRRIAGRVVPPPIAESAFQPRRFGI